MKHAIGKYEATTTDERLKVARNLLMNARKEFYDIDEANTDDDKPYACSLLVDGDRDYYGIHPDVRTVMQALDTAIVMTAKMQDR